jgi:HPt (histidine-containing phosphotransfer) domain-containing protein
VRVISELLRSNQLATPRVNALTEFALTEITLTEIITQNVKFADLLIGELNKQVIHIPNERVPWSIEASPGGQELTNLIARQAQLTETAIAELVRSQQHILSEFEKLHRAILDREPVQASRAPIQAKGAASSVSSRAFAEIDASVDRLRGEGVVGTDEHWELLVRDSESRRVAWTKDGSLVKTQELAKKWGRTRQALDQAVERGELFNLKIGSRRWYPAVFARLTAEDVRQVNLALSSSSPVSKFVFWNRSHGGLGGKTVESAIRGGQLARVIELAEAWADERGGEALSIHAANA